MDTNLVQSVVSASVHASNDMNFLTITLCPHDPWWWSLLELVTVAACAAVAVLALRNAAALLRREVVPRECAQVPRRLAISGYLLMFLAAMWVFRVSAWLCFAVWNASSCEQGPAQMNMLVYTFRPCFFLAIALLILTALHCAVGIAFEIRKQRLPP